MGPLAQSVEQQTFNLWVVGSIPTGPTISCIGIIVNEDTATLNAAKI